MFEIERVEEGIKLYLQCVIINRPLPDGIKCTIEQNFNILNL